MPLQLNLNLMTVDHPSQLFCETQVYNNKKRRGGIPLLFYWAAMTLNAYNTVHFRHLFLEYPFNTIFQCHLTHGTP